MQTLQLQNIELQSSAPNLKTELHSPIPQESRGGISFERLLRSETEVKHISEKVEEKTPVSDSSKTQISKTQGEDGKKPNFNDEKIASHEEDVENAENAAVENAEYFIGRLQNEMQSENPSLDEGNIEFVAEIGETEADQPLSRGNISWLFKKENVSNNENDFDALIEEAVDFTETDSDILERLQNLSTSDPELFLSKAEKFASENENFAANLNGDNLKNAFDASKDKKATSPATKITVRDYRTTKGDGENKNADSIVKSAAKNSKNQLDFNLNQNESSKNQVTFELNARADATQNILASSNQAAGANGSTFETMLSQSIQTNAPDFVKAGTVILKDEGKGSINLILHPESLGNVKVNLSLNDKTLSGVITVQSQEAFNAFKENLETLKNAFAQNGFENVDFNLNFSNGNEAGQNFAQNQNDEAASRERAKFAYGEYISLNPTEDFTENYITDGSYAVNLVA